MQIENKAGHLNKSLSIFFLNALKVAVTMPFQAFSFLKTLIWLGKAAGVRKKYKKQGIIVPPIIIFSITHNCNLKCKGCYAQSLQEIPCGELSDAQMADIIMQSKALGVSFFVIAGGEPLTRKELLKTTAHYPEMVFLLITNGLLIDDDLILNFKKQKNVIPLISLEGGEDETDARRGAGTFNTIEQKMLCMKRKRIFFGISLTLTKMNCSVIIDENYIKKLMVYGCKFVLFLEYTPAEQGTEDWALTQEQRSLIETQIPVFRAKYPALFIAVPWDEESEGGCLSAGRGFVHINASGNLEPCPFAPFSDTNIREHSLKTALQSPLLEQIRSNPRLAIEKGDGCILWKERELVKSLLAETRSSSNQSVR